MSSQQMPKASLTSAFLCLRLLALVGMIGRVVEGERCSEGLGVCGGDCGERCALIHEGGKGSCETIGNVPVCACRYDCSPLPSDCQGGAGVCSAQDCWTDCCNLKCAEKYQGGAGFCSVTGAGIVLCQCQFPCPP